MTGFIFIFLFITAIFALIMLILKVQERHIKEDGANFEEYIYKRDLRKNKNNQIIAIVIYIVIMAFVIMYSLA